MIESPDESPEGGPRLDETALRAALLQAYSRLEDEVQALATAVARTATDWWAWRAPYGAAKAFDPTPQWTLPQALEQIREGIRALTYAEDQKNVESLIFPALVCVPDSTRELAQQVNQAKTAFEQAAKAMRGKLRDEYSERKARVERLSLLRYALRRAAKADVNYWQATRHFVVLNEQPRLIGFTWVYSQQIIKRSVAQVREDLLAHRLSGALGDQVAEDLQRLAALADDELLAERMTWTPHPRANIVIETSQGTRRFTRRGTLPILLPGPRLPMFRPLAAAPLPKGYRARRSDARLHPEPLLATIPVHRYREPPSRTEQAATDQDMVGE